MRAKAAFLTREAGIQFTNPVLSVGNPGRHMACPGVFCFCGGGRGGRRRFRGWFGVACRWRGAGLPKAIAGPTLVAGGCDACAR